MIVLIASMVGGLQMNSFRITSMLIAPQLTRASQTHAVMSVLIAAMKIQWRIQGGGGAQGARASGGPP